MRMVTLAVITCLIAVAGPAAADPATPDRENGRYTFKDVPDGLLRLDTRSGQVSLCDKRAAGWACQALPDDRTALEDEIARIDRENALLRKQLIARGVPLPDGVKEPRTAKRDQDLKLPSDAELDRVMTVMEKMWRRLIDMVQRIHRDMDKSSADKL